MTKIRRIGNAEDILQKILDDYLTVRGAVAASVCITFKDGEQIRFHGRMIETPGESMQTSGDPALALRKAG